LGQGFVGDAIAKPCDQGGDVSSREEWTLIGVAVLLVEVHELDAGNGETCAFDNMRLDGCVREMLALDRSCGFDFGDDPAIGFLRERVDGDEDVVFEEAGFEDGGRAFFDGLARGLNGEMGTSVVELDECGASELLARAFAYAGTHVESGLEGGVGFELGGAGVVGLPPELAVALEAGGEPGFGKAVGHQLPKVAGSGGGGVTRSILQIPNKAKDQPVLCV
jgi:hypothetical protein